MLNETNMFHPVTVKSKWNKFMYVRVCVLRQQIRTLWRMNRYITTSWPGYYALNFRLCVLPTFRTLFMASIGLISVFTLSYNVAITAYWIGKFVHRKSGYMHCVAMLMSSVFMPSGWLMLSEETTFSQPGMPSFFFNWDSNLEGYLAPVSSRFTEFAVVN
jgi:hypothetical protein